MKRLLALLLAVLLTLALYACGDSAADTNTSTTTSTSATTSPSAAGGFEKPADYASVVTVTINPQFRLYLDAAGAVLAVEPVNADAKSVADKLTVKGGSVKAVVNDLVTAANDGGFVKENATVDIAVTEIADTAVSTDTVLAAVKEAASDSFAAIEVPVQIKTTVPADVTTLAVAVPTQAPNHSYAPDIGGDAGATTPSDAPTTATKAPTAATKAPTTTKVNYTSFKKSDWEFRVIIEEADGAKFCRTYTIKFTDGDLRIGESSAAPYEEMVPEEYRDQEEPSFSFGGIDWLVGAGGYVPLTSAKESGNTLTLTDEDGKTMVLTRTGETTAKVVSNTIDIPVKKNDVFTAVAPVVQNKPSSSYTSVKNKGGAWMGGFVAEDGTYRLIALTLSGDELCLDMAIGDPLSGFPEEVQAEMKPDCEEFGGKFYYFGRGDGGALTKVEETDDSVILHAADKTLRLVRTDENTLTVNGSSPDFSVLGEVPLGTAFTFAAEQ